jgi:hypothetical protein
MYARQIQIALERDGVIEPIAMFGATRALLNAVVGDIETALEQIEALNLGLAKETLAKALEKLPSENDVHPHPWPDSEHFNAATAEIGFRVSP